MSVVMDIHDILEHLPQRPPFLMIDRVIEFIPNESLVAIKNVTMNEPFFAGHFPGRPVMPGVMILEALAQAGGILAQKSSKAGNRGENYIYLFAGVDKARFKRVVEPGDQMRLEIKVLSVRRDFWKVQGIARVGDDIACSAELMSIGKDMAS
ncbi:MAG: 3-hydroxyacyl-[acyl-carrier-protein] dehydratase FabZ [marine bacterium B5-7]|nr:MAG: 3-hydroxyacyl-[acyl-carrier-protein] dehydratase FabZ [marine bacterium B5-7]